MAKFNFHLQRVLDYKLQLEEEAKIKLGRAIMEMSAKEQEIQNIKKELENIIRILGKADASEEEMWLYIQTEKNLLTDLTRAKQELELLIDKVDKCKKNLIQKTIERKKIEKLKEQQKKRFIYEEQQNEQKEIDEISTLKYERLFK